jgi:hypothetical protein
MMRRPNWICHLDNATLWLALTVGLAVYAPALAQSRFSYSADGSEVNDAKTGLVWRRCIAGKSWSGTTCTGAASAFTHESALAHAQSTPGWRLPNVKELGSLVDRSRSGPSIDTTAFPMTSSDYFWTSTPYFGRAFQAWGVSFDNGIGAIDRSYLYQVRLVRVQP